MAFEKIKTDHVPQVKDQANRGWCYIVGPKALQKLAALDVLDEMIDDGSLVMLSMETFNARH